MKSGQTADGHDGCDACGSALHPREDTEGGLYLACPRCDAQCEVVDPRDILLNKMAKALEVCKEAIFDLGYGHNDLEEMFCRGCGAWAWQECRPKCVVERSHTDITTALDEYKKHRDERGF